MTPVSDPDDVVNLDPSDHVFQPLLGQRKHCASQGVLVRKHLQARFEAQNFARLSPSLRAITNVENYTKSVPQCRKAGIYVQHFEHRNIIKYIGVKSKA